MPIIKSISAAACGGRLTSVGAAAPVRRIEAAVSPRERVFVVPAEQLKLLRQAQIVPPASGMLDIGEVDRRLQSSGMSIADRMAVKATLRNCGLLAAGLPR
jgi:hypothetical protein